MLDITAHVNAIAEGIHENRRDGQRFVVGIAGAPGSGKSTLANETARRLRQQSLRTEVVQMDGWHLDNELLDARGKRQRKGAPETFDAAGFVMAVRRLKSPGEVIFPRFDRQRDISVGGVVAVDDDTAVVLVEGNYLLFDEEPWAELAEYWDLSAYLDVPMADLRARLIQRWLSHGLSRAAATKRAESNDIPNAQRVVDHPLAADLLLTTAH